MKNIIGKEIRLVIPPISYLLMLLAALLLIPNYPYIIALSYSLLSIQIIFSVARANKDHEFMAALPIPRSHIVYGKHFSIAFIQLLQVVFAIPFALISALVLNKTGNEVGIDANFTLFGTLFICYSVFNLVLMPWYFQTGYKAGIPIIVAVLSYFAVYMIQEIIFSAIPSANTLFDGYSLATIGYRLLYLASGFAVYAVSLILSCKISVKNFEKVSL